MTFLTLLRNYGKFVTVAILLLTILLMLFKSTDDDTPTVTRVIQSDISSLLSRLTHDNSNLGSAETNNNKENEIKDTEEMFDDDGEESNTDEEDNNDLVNEGNQIKINIEAEDETAENNPDNENLVDTKRELTGNNDLVNEGNQIKLNIETDEETADKELTGIEELTDNDDDDESIEKMNKGDTGDNENNFITESADHLNINADTANTDIAHKLHIPPFKFDHFARVEDVPDVINTNVNCSAIIEGNEDAIEQAKFEQTGFKEDLNLIDKLLTLTKTCDIFLKQRKYILNPVNQEEADFPIAFSIVMYKDIFQVERLLRAIYRPQNLYCIHVDRKSSNVLHEIMHNIAGCLDNVFIATKKFDVRWGWFSVVKPELACMEDLLNHTRPWHYFINTCGQEFPLKTNLELVKILKAFNGSNDVQGRRSDIIPQVMTRIKYGYTNEGPGAKKYLKPPFPYNITWAKGAVHVAVTKGFVDFLINTKLGQDFVKYINDTPHASEHMFNPLHLSPQLGVPGSYTGFPDIKHDPVQGISVIRYKIWADTPRRYKEYQCHGVWSRQICIIALGDLHLVVNSGKLFVNKLHAGYHPIAYNCLEEYNFNNTRLDIQGINRLNLTYYEKLDFVKNHI